MKNFHVMNAEVEVLEVRVLMHSHEARYSHGENSTQTMLDYIPDPELVLPKFLMKENCTIVNIPC
jgi:hypothetical protein